MAGSGEEGKSNTDSQLLYLARAKDNNNEDDHRFKPLVRAQSDA